MNLKGNVMNSTEFSGKAAFITGASSTMSPPASGRQAAAH